MMKTTLARVLLSLLGCFFGATALCTAGEQSRPPNIVFIIADDLGWTDLGCQGSKFYETPHIDKLAAQGLRFTSYYSSPNCTPSRAAIFSGQYAPRTGVYTVGTLARGEEKDRKLVPPQNRTQLPLDRDTLAQALKASGYATGHFGKWHIGEKGDYHPGRRGFDEAIVSMGKHYDFATNPKADFAKDTYLADFLTDKAVDFIARHKERPFFLYVAHFAVHTPLVAKKGLAEKYRNKPAADGHHDPVYAAMIDSVDESVGRILAKLDELKLADNTIVIFTSDNGGVGGYVHNGVVFAKSITSNFPLRAGKGTLYEGGIRVPFIVRWPSKTPPGKRCDFPIMHIDFFPTFVQIAGGKFKARQTLDGLSFASLLENPGATLKRDALYHHFPGYLEGKPGLWRTTPVGWIRSGDFTLLEYFEDGRLELYNVKDDQGQKINLAEKTPVATRELHQKLVAWRTSLGAALPEPKQNGGCLALQPPHASPACVQILIIPLSN
ncbi:MAG: sulfatase [Gemmataceae bacterium]|nr:sulfatase [Gemmataceae bacterium]MCI0739905.1 sulfatase [Gemmataceae bacterium]